MKLIVMPKVSEPHGYGLATLIFPMSSERNANIPWVSEGMRVRRDALLTSKQAVFVLVSAPIVLVVVVLVLGWGWKGPRRFARTEER
jgi:hypothetical protein